MEETRQNVIYLHKEDLIWENLQHILADEECLNKEFGGRVANANSLDYLIGIVKDNTYYPTLESKAALYSFKIITDHIFMDGNKRTGMSSALWFLGENNAYFKRLPDNLLTSSAELIAMGKMTYEDIVSLIQEHIRFRKHPRHKSRKTLHRHKMLHPPSE